MLEKKICEFKDNNRSVATIVGYILTLSLCMFILASSIFTINAFIENRSKAAGSVQAQSIANRISNIILDAAVLKQNNPNAGFEKVIEIPNKLGTFDYYIELTDSAVFVESHNGLVKEKSTLYRVIKLNNGNTAVFSGISGRIHVDSNSIKIIVDDSSPSQITIEGVI